MLTLRVNEIFYALQGEGRRAGEPSIFIRLTGCDLTCGFCDTEFEGGKLMTVQEVVQEIKHFPAAWIVWTGGEPCLQLTDAHVAFFNDKGFHQAIETNGNHRAPAGLEWICVSPKVAEHVVKKNFAQGVQELRYARHAGHMSVPQPKITAEHYYLSPIFDGGTMDKQNLAAVVALVLENPKWKLSIQTHKLTGSL